MTETAQEFRYFVNRLLGPRPTFPMDISPEETALMGAHAQYWMKHMAEGRVVVFGPVLDPKGVWGMGVVRARDEAEMQTMLAGDPVIVANRGFSYEMLPMMRAVVPS
jgi:uncharacterized protein YciI